MKALVCEMCQSTELLKQDGVFVCQHCGTKYSVEEAKKMMVEGSVEVQGVVEVKNTAQAENLMSLAKKSYESKNYAQAEEFCNQIIAMDGANYFAWKLKGEAINYQITGTNDRIEEVYNCIMTSYEVLDEAGKDEHREEILKSLRVCLEGEIDFALGLLKSQRPKDNILAKVQKTFVNCASKGISAYKALGFSEEEANKYSTYIKNYFIEKANKISAAVWDNVVYYNYYRDGFTDEYRPDTTIMMTYLNEGDNLIDLLTFCEKYFTEETPLAQKRENYRLQNFFQRKLINATSYKRMVETTTNGYGAVLRKDEYWAEDKTLTDSAKASRNKEINRTCDLFDKIEVEIAKSNPATRDKMIKSWIAERDSIDLTCRLSGGCIVSTILMVALAFVAFAFAPDWFSRNSKWLAYFFGVCFSLISLVFLWAGYANAKQTQESNQAEYNRLTNKINELKK